MVLTSVHTKRQQILLTKLTNFSFISNYYIFPGCVARPKLIRLVILFISLAPLRQTFEPIFFSPLFLPARGRKTAAQMAAGRWAWMAVLISYSHYACVAGPLSPFSIEPTRQQYIVQVCKRRGREPGFLVCACVERKLICMR